MQDARFYDDLPQSIDDTSARCPSFNARLQWTNIQESLSKWETLPQPATPGSKLLQQV